MDEEEKDLEIKYSALGGRESPGTASSRGANDMPKKKKKVINWGLFIRQLMES